MKTLALENGNRLYGDLKIAIKDIDSLLRSSDLSREIQELRILLAPTGNLQELSIDCGWGDEFCELAEKIEKIKLN